MFIPLGVMVLAWLGSGGGRRASGVGVTVGPSAVSVLAVAAAGAVTGPPGSAACPDDVAVEAHAEPVLDLHRGRLLRSSLATRSARSECTATVPSRRLSLGPPAGSQPPISYPSSAISWLSVSLVRGSRRFEEGHDAGAAAGSQP